MRSAGETSALDLVEALIVDRFTGGDQRVDAVLRRHRVGGSGDEHVPQRGRGDGREPVGVG